MAKTVLDTFYQQPLWLQIASLTGLSIGWPAMLSMSYSSSSGVPVASVILVVTGFAAVAAFYIGGEQVNKNYSGQHSGIGIKFIGVVIGLSLIASSYFTGKILHALLVAGVSLFLGTIAAALIGGLVWVTGIGFLLAFEDLRRVFGEAE